MLSLRLSKSTVQKCKYRSGSVATQPSWRGESEPIPKISTMADKQRRKVEELQKLVGILCSVDDLLLSPCAHQVEQLDQRNKELESQLSSATYKPEVVRPAALNRLP